MLRLQGISYIWIKDVYDLLGALQIFLILYLAFLISMVTKCWDLIEALNIPPIKQAISFHLQVVSNFYFL
jgi:hypothetical protein